MLEPLRDWNGLGVVTRHDAPTDAWFFIALHDATLGPMVGGTRLRVYPSPREGVLDAIRLAEGMTYKWAGISVPYGGGKGVIALPRPLAAGERTPLLERYARLVAALGGRFMTGQDLGTTPEDMLVLAGETQYVHGIDYATRTAVDPGPYTAYGVFVGIGAALEVAFGSPSLAGRTVLIQGVGDVGEPLAGRLAEAGARVLVSDLDPARARTVAGAAGGEVVGAEAVYGTPCDVYAPCAVGATLSAESIPRLACRVVAGSANNQLAEAADAERLHARGIVYAPDYIVNAGGAAAFAALKRGVRDEAELYARVERIGRALASLLREAAEANESPVAAARRRVERVLHRGATES